MTRYHIELWHYDTSTGNSLVDRIVEDVPDDAPMDAVSKILANQLAAWTVGDGDSITISEV
jgi:hypothetical protein